MSKVVFITKKTLEEIKATASPSEIEILKEIEKTPVLGYIPVNLKEWGREVPIHGGSLLGVVEEIGEIPPESCLKSTSIKSGDLIVSVNGARLGHYRGGKIYVKEKTGYDFLHEFCKDGEEVVIEYLSKVKSNRRNPFGFEDNIEHKSVSVKLKFLYVVADETLKKKIQKHSFKNLPTRMKEKIFNQDRAIDQVYKSLKIFFAGLKDASKPIGGYLFVGPTGVGKTEVAKLLAENLGFNLVRIDMSEYSQEHTVSRLIGSPPSYIGYGDKTILEQEIGDNGRKVVLLLDEMEKAHPELQKVFLQALDNGKITLGNNKEINMTNTLILMTSNLGIITKQSLGLNNSEDKLLSVDMDSIRRHFLPEFIGRLSGIVEFNPLTEAQALVILEKFVKEFNDQHLKNKGMQIELSSDAKGQLIKKGFNKMYGARPMKQALANEVFEKVADLLLVTDEEDYGRTIAIDFNGLEFSAKFLDQFTLEEV